jgi:hypothetical protein
MRILTPLVAATLAAFAVPTLAQTPPSGAAVLKATEPGKGVIAEVVRVAATVEAVDAANRLVTLKGPEGNSFVVKAGPEIRNFDRIKVGDIVDARFTEALTLELKKGGGGVRERIESESAGVSKPGERPAAAAGRTVTVVADVIAVNAAKQSVRLRGPNRTVDLKVRDPEQFKLIKVGDQVEARFTESVAIALDPAPQPAAKK